MKALRELETGAGFRIPGDARSWELVELYTGSALVRPAKGSGARRELVDPKTGETRFFETRHSRAVSLGTLVEPVGQEAAEAPCCPPDCQRLLPCGCICHDEPL